MTEASLSASDVLAIRDLYARYNHAIHRGDAEAWARCFTADGRFSNLATSVSGTAALTAYAEGWIGNGRNRYWIDNLILTATAEGMTGACYLTILNPGGEGRLPSVQLTGVYTDELVREGERWLFRSRHIARDE